MTTFNRVKNLPFYGLETEELLTLPPKSTCLNDSYLKKMNKIKKVYIIETSTIDSIFSQNEKLQMTIEESQNQIRNEQRHCQSEEDSNNLVDYILERTNQQLFDSQEKIKVLIEEKQQLVEKLKQQNHMSSAVANVNESLKIAELETKKITKERDELYKFLLGIVG